MGPSRRHSSLRELGNMSGRPLQRSNTQARPQKNGKANNFDTQSLTRRDDDSFLGFMRILEEEQDEPAMSHELESPSGRHSSLTRESSNMSGKSPHRSKAQ